MLADRRFHVQALHVRARGLYRVLRNTQGGSHTTPPGRQPSPKRRPPPQEPPLAAAPDRERWPGPPLS
jgi:hypothetical protein